MSIGMIYSRSNLKVVVVVDGREIHAISMLSVSKEMSDDLEQRERLLREIWTIFAIIDRLVIIKISKIRVVNFLQFLSKNMLKNLYFACRE